MRSEAAKQSIVENILGSTDVQDLLMVNRQRLKALVDAGKLTPVKQLKKEQIFWMPDVLALKKEMMLDTRTNLFKSAGSKSEILN